MPDKSPNQPEKLLVHDPQISFDSLVAYVRANRPKLFNALLLVGVLVYALSKGEEIARSVSGIHDVFSPKPDALEVWRVGAKDAFSRELLMAGWRRWHRTNIYISLVENRSNKPELNDAWMKYMESVDDWNSHYMVNVLGLRQYYGTKPEEGFQRIIQNWYGSIHSCMIALRAMEGDKQVAKCGQLNEARDRTVVIETLKYYQHEVFWHFYYFAWTLNPKPAKGDPRYMDPDEVLQLLDYRLAAKSSPNR